MLILRPRAKLDALPAQVGICQLRGHYPGFPVNDQLFHGAMDGHPAVNRVDEIFCSLTWDHHSVVPSRASVDQVKYDAFVNKYEIAFNLLVEDSGCFDACDAVWLGLAPCLADVPCIDNGVNKVNDFLANGAPPISGLVTLDTVPLCCGG